MLMYIIDEDIFMCMYVCTVSIFYICVYLDGYHFKREHSLTVLDQVGGHKVKSCGTIHIHAYTHAYIHTTLGALIGRVDSWSDIVRDQHSAVGAEEGDDGIKPVAHSATSHRYWC